MGATLGSGTDLARAFVRVAGGVPAAVALAFPRVAPEASAHEESPFLDPPEPEPEPEVAAVTVPAGDVAVGAGRRCAVCGAPLTGLQRRFCSDAHRAAWHVSRRRTVRVALHEALADVQRAVGRLQQVCDELVTGALRGQARPVMADDGAERDDGAHSDDQA